MGDFERDNGWQLEIRNRILGPAFYGRRALEGRYVFMDKGRLASLMQRRYEVDTIMQGSNGAALCIEEKIVRFPKSGVPYQAFSLETHSCTVNGHESDGWMRYGQADYLLYCFAQNADPVHELIAWLIDFPRLQEWFWPRESSFPRFGPLPTLNKTKGRVVPIRDVQSSVLHRVFEICDPRSDRPMRQLSFRFGASL